MLDSELEAFFAKRYGPVQNCKVAKDASGRPKTYGFVWFREGRHANAAMLDFKSGTSPFKLDWYKILGQRQTGKETAKAEYDSISVAWRNSDSVRQEDLINYFSKFGTITDLQFEADCNKARLTFSNPSEAEFACIVPEQSCRNFTVQVTPVGEAPRGPSKMM